MRDLPFSRPGRFWRGSLHAHFKATYGFPLTDTRAQRSPAFRHGPHQRRPGLEQPGLAQLTAGQLSW